MTDKVQKIREEVVRMHNLLPVMDGDNISVNYADRICTTLEMYIDSLQEEPVPKIFKDMLNAKTPVESLGISAEEHDKFIDLCLYGKEPEMVDIDDLPKEEPISNDLKEASRNYADKEKFRKEVEKLKSNLIHGACSSQIAMETRCKEEAYNEVLAILDTMQEEPVSEDLEKMSYHSAMDLINNPKFLPTTTFGELIPMLQKLYKDGAKWQREQIEEALLSEVLTWEDVKTIDKLLNQCVDCNNPYQEVLKRFKDYKERKEK